MKRNLLVVVSMLLALFLVTPVLQAQEKITLTVLNYLTSRSNASEINEVWEEFEGGTPHHRDPGRSFQ